MADFRSSHVSVPKTLNKRNGMRPKQLNFDIFLVVYTLKCVNLSILSWLWKPNAVKFEFARDAFKMYHSQLTYMV